MVAMRPAARKPGPIANSRLFYPDIYQNHHSPGSRPKPAFKLSFICLSGRKTWCFEAGISHEVHRHCDHRRRPCRLDRGRNARPRRDSRGPDRPASGLSVRLPRRKTERRRAARTLLPGPASPNSVLRSATHDGENWIARFGYLLDKRPSRQFGIMYDALINAIRAEIPQAAELVYAKVTAISTSAERQKLTLVERRDDLGAAGRAGQRIEYRAAPQARHRTPDHQRLPLDLDRLRPGAGRPRGFRFSGADLFLGTAERPHPLSDAVSGRQADARQPVHLSRDRRSLAARDAPRAGRDHEAALPRLRRITGEFAVAGDVKIRPADLYVSTGYRQPGIVLVGDAFATTCPVTGTGTDKVFTDVAQLCNVHIPAWLATEGMGDDKIASFYDDPVKQACDAWSSAKAYQLPQGHDRQRALLARAALGALPGVVRRRHIAAATRAESARDRSAHALTPPRRHPHRRHLRCRRPA